MRCLEEGKSSFVASVEETLAASFLGTLAGRSRSPPSPSLPTRKPSTQQQEDVLGSGTLPNGATSQTRTEGNAAASRAVGAVRRMEDAARAAERAAAVLNQGETGMVSPENSAASGAQAERGGYRRDEGDEEVVYCCKCASLFAANERLLEEARSQGFLD